MMNLPLSPHTWTDGIHKIKFLEVKGIESVRLCVWEF